MFPSDGMPMRQNSLHLLLLRLCLPSPCCSVLIRYCISTTCGAHWEPSRRRYHRANGGRIWACVQNFSINLRKKSENLSLGINGGAVSLGNRSCRPSMRQNGISMQLPPHHASCRPFWNGRNTHWNTAAVVVAESQNHFALRHKLIFSPTYHNVY